MLNSRFNGHKKTVAKSVVEIKLNIIFGWFWFITDFSVPQNDLITN